MPRPPKRALLALPWIGMAGLVYIVLHNTLSGWWDTSSQAHSTARQDYFAELRFEGCVRQDAVIALAETRDWRVELMAEPLGWCHAPAGLTGWVHVEVSPPLPFSTVDENAAYIGFDENGCMTRWHYASGVGSTCPNH